MKIWSFGLAIVVAAAFGGSVQAASVGSANANLLPNQIFNTDPTSFSGIVDYRTGWNPGQWRTPFQNTDTSKIEQYHDTQPYLSIQGGANATWAGAGNAITLFWGSPDTYNLIEFFTSNDASGTAFDSITGAAVVPPGTNQLGHVLATIVAKGFFNSVRLSSGSNAFELTNFEIICTTCAISFDTPIPGALPLFASGLGMLGFYGWRRRKSA